MSLPHRIAPDDIKAGRRLIIMIAAELKAGTRHYSEVDGRELTTVPAILRELLYQGRLDLRLPDGRREPEYLRPA
jgi:hypothetical protein